MPSSKIIINTLSDDWGKSLILKMVTLYHRVKIFLCFLAYNIIFLGTDTANVILKVYKTQERETVPRTICVLVW